LERGSAFVVHFRLGRYGLRRFATLRLRKDAPASASNARDVARVTKILAKDVTYNAYKSTRQGGIPAGSLEV